jgi:hypothetical protein
MWINMSKIKKCRSCSSEKIEAVWELETTPYGELFKTSMVEAKKLGLQFLTLVICNNCSLLQLLNNPEIQVIYENYLYRTSITNPLFSYYNQLANRAVNDYRISKNDLVVDIGSNDGTFLENFKDKGIKVLGVEPTLKSAQVAIDNGIATFNGYFDVEACNFIKAQSEKAALVSTNYVLANIVDLKSFFTLITSLMTDKTVFSVVTGYHPDQFAVNMFEYINHDHLFYFTLKSFKNLCENFDLKIIDATRIEHKGGSIQFVVVKNSSQLETQSSVSQIAQREQWLNCNSVEYVLNFKSNIENIKASINNLLSSIDEPNVYGVGASISTTQLCNQCNLSQKIKYIFDDDINKIGRYTPGSGIEVKALSELPNDSNSFLIILAWQHTNRIINRLKEVKFRGKVVIPLPNPRIISL